MRGFGGEEREGGNDLIISKIGVFYLRKKSSQ